MKTGILPILLLILLPSLALADMAPQHRGRVLVVSPYGQGNLVFPNRSINGYNGNTLVWLLNRLGFQVTICLTNTTTNFNATEQATILPLLNSSNYKAMFFADGDVHNYAVCMRNFVNAAISTGVPGYVMARSASSNYTLSGDPFYVGATSGYWQPAVDCPLTMSGFAATDTLWLHGSSHAFFMPAILPTDSLGANVTRLIWKVGFTNSADTTLMWKWHNVVICAVAEPPVGSFLVVSQFLKDASLTKYVDYIPLVMTLQLDGDGLFATPYNDGLTGKPWRDTASQLRTIGIKHLYFSNFETNGTWTGGGTHYDSLFAVWPQISDVFYYNEHGPDVGALIWPLLSTFDDMQYSFSHMYAEAAPHLAGVAADSSEMRQLQTHRYEWSLPNGKFFLKKGCGVLGGTQYHTVGANDYITNITTYLCGRFMPSGIDSGYIQLVPFLKWNPLADYSTYAASYAALGGTRGLAAAYLIGRLGIGTEWGYQPYFHATVISGNTAAGADSGQYVLPDFYLPAVLGPFLKATSPLWELDNNVTNIRALAIRESTQDGQ